MTRLTDGRLTVEIEMIIWTGEGYTPDFSGDFFGGATYDEEKDSLIVNDTIYCIEQALDWENGIGEYNDNPNHERRVVNLMTSRGERKIK